MRVNLTVTVGADPINIYTGTAAAPTETDPVYAKELVIQMAAGGAGVGYVMMDIQNGRIPDPTVDTTAQLAPAGADTPGASYTDLNGKIRVNLGWVDGANAGDKIIVSYDPEV